MDSNRETRDTWNKIASLYEKKFMNLTVYNETYDVLCAATVRQNSRVLDIGCGPGNITRYLLAQRPDFEILGIDTSPDMIALAQKNNPGAEFRVMDAREIRRLNTHFDIIVCGFCIPYLTPQETQQLILDSGALLNADGRLYLSFVEGPPEQSAFKTGSGGRVYFNYHLLNDLLGCLQDSDFIDIRTFRVEYCKNEAECEEHTIAIARKK